MVSVPLTPFARRSEVFVDAWRVGFRAQLGQTFDIGRATRVSRRAAIVQGILMLYSRSCIGQGSPARAAGRHGGLQGEDASQRKLRNTKRNRPEMPAAPP
jgi:hypothetical protein